MSSPEVKEIPTSNDDPTVGATHKITYNVGSDRFSYYYFFLRTPECRPFVRTQDDEFVNELHRQGGVLHIEGSVSFKAQLGGYNVQRLSRDVFTVTSLQ